MSEKKTYQDLQEDIAEDGIGEVLMTWETEEIYNLYMKEEDLEKKGHLEKLLEYWPVATECARVLADEIGWPEEESESDGSGEIDGFGFENTDEEDD